MATGRSKFVSYSVPRAYGEAVETPCTFCKTRDKKVESTNFCVECRANMCRECTERHKLFPRTMSHRAFGIVSASSARKSRAQLPTQRCEVHHHMVIERFCIEHKELACGLCVSQRHRNCKNLEYIPLCSKGVKTSQELAASKVSTESVLKALVEFQSTHRETLLKLDIAELQCQQVLQEQRDKLVNRILDLAKADSAKIKSKFQGEKTAVKENINAADYQIGAMEAIVKGLKQSKGENESDMFVYMKQGEKTEKEGKQLLHTQQQLHKQIPKYNFHNTIEKFLGDFNALGEFEEVAGLKPTSLKPALKPVRLKLRGEYNVGTSKDESACNITGVCFLPDASLIITDWKGNNNMKQLDNSYKVIRSLDMGAEPFDVCYTKSNYEVAVTLFNEKMVQFVSVGVMLRKTRSFSVRGECWGITCSNEQLFVCCTDSLYPTIEMVGVFSLAGKQLRTILFDQNGHPLFSNMRRITVSSCGNKLYVTDEGIGVITMDKSGNLQQKFHDNDLVDPTGMCSLDNGDLLVGGCDSNNVMHVSRDGRKLAVVLGKQDGLNRLQVLAYDQINSRIIVTLGRCDTIKVYDMK